MIVTYRHRPKSKRPTVSQPAKITGGSIVTARRPKKYQVLDDEPADDPEADEGVRQFFARMGLSLLV
jgi:hypothetical protein